MGGAFIRPVGGRVRLGPSASRRVFLRRGKPVVGFGVHPPRAVKSGVGWVVVQRGKYFDFRKMGGWHADAFRDVASMNVVQQKVEEVSKWLHTFVKATIDAHNTFDGDHISVVMYRPKDAGDDLDFMVALANGSVPKLMAVEFGRSEWRPMYPVAPLRSGVAAVAALFKS